DRSLLDRWPAVTAGAGAPEPALHDTATLGDYSTAGAPAAPRDRVARRCGADLRLLRQDEHGPAGGPVRVDVPARARLESLSRGVEVPVRGHPGLRRADPAGAGDGLALGAVATARTRSRPRARRHRSDGHGGGRGQLRAARRAG